MAKQQLSLEQYISEHSHQLCDELPIGLAICNADGVVTDCNQTYLSIIGVSKQDFLGYNIFDSYNFTDEEMEKIRTSDYYQYDVLYTVPKDVFKNSSVDKISVSTKIVRRTENGQTSGYTIYLTNHTDEWQRYESQLHTQEKRYQTLVDSLPLDYTHTKLIFGEDGQIVDYLNMSGNKSCNEFYAKHNMTWGETYAMKFLARSGPEIIAKLNELRNSGVSGGHFTFNATDVGEVYEMVAVFEGEEWVNLISIPITALEKEKTQVEIELTEQLAIFDALADAYSNVFLVEPDAETLKIMKLNGYVTTGLSKESRQTYPYAAIKNQYVSERVLPEDQEMMFHAIDIGTVRDALANSNEYIGNYRVLHDGKTHYYQFKYVRLKDFNYVIAGFQNIDAIIEQERQQQAELSRLLAKAEQSNKEKSAFLNSMSHDIRTPMNAIIGFTALAQSHIDNAELVQDYLDKISTSSTHLFSLINDVLERRRFQSGAVKLEEKPVYIPDLMQNLHTMVQGLVASKKQKLTIDAQSVQHQNIMADHLRLSQVMINIVDNAIKYTPNGGSIAIRVVELPCSKPNRAAYQFTVKDNGIGMSSEFVGRIFDDFSREYSSTISGIQGTGLGMSITKSIVDLMGGKIEVESEEGKGSTFVVTAEFQLADQLATAVTGIASAQSAQNALPDYSDKHVLLVEDNELNREIAIALLSETGMTIDCAADGIEAVETMQRAQDDQYDLILMDIQMPRMDGYAATRAIRAMSNSKKASVPIVAMTANAFAEDRETALNTGMNGHIAKPIDMNNVARVLNAVFEK
jgi:signal transduction histidine kinase/CheY-like chemotaxis protein